MASNALYVQLSLSIWFPPSVRKRIESIYWHYPNGFVCNKQVEMTGIKAMDLATLGLDQFLAAWRAKAKLQAIVAFNSLLLRVRHRQTKEEDAMSEM